MTDQKNNQDKSKGSKEPVGRERRKEARHPINDLLIGYISHADGRDIKVQLDDISNAGVSFLVKKSSDCLSENQVVKLSFYINNTETYFQCEYRIKQIIQTPSHQFRHSAEILRDSPNLVASEFLVGFIQNVKFRKGHQLA